MDSQSKKTLFQTILLVVFGFAVIIAIAIFSISKSSSTSKPGQLSGPITVWGVLPSEAMKANFDALQGTYPDLKITYVEKNMQNLESDLVEALADGTGPDIFTLTPEMLIKQKQRLLIIPYTSFSDTLFKSTFVDQSNLFMTPEGIAGFPMYINPLVMYVNNDILTTNYVVKIPTTWEELVDLAPTLVKKNDAGAIIQPMIGMGLYDNVRNALPIIATLLFQSGDNITTILPGTNQVVSLPSNTGSAVFDFYSGFAQPDSYFYNYNPSIALDRDMFIAGRSSFYIGFADELPQIRAKNPNLNFDVAMVPSPANGSGGRYIIFGQMTGWGINKNSKNINTALGLLQVMSGGDFITSILNGTWVAPARKDMLSVLPAADAIRVIIYKSAILSRSFLNPDNVEVANSLRLYINQIQSGIESSATAYSSWVADMSTILNQKQKL